MLNHTDKQGPGAEVPTAQPPLTDGLRSRPVFSVKRYANWDEAEVLERAWNELLAQSAARTIFLTWEWMKAWWGAFGAHRDLVLLTLTDTDGKLAVIVPFQRTWEKLGPRNSGWLLRLAGDGIGGSENLDWIVREGCEGAAVRAIADWLDQNKSYWDSIRLDTVPGASPVLSALKEELCQREWRQVERHSTGYSLHLPESWEELMVSLPKNMRAQINRRVRKLNKQFSVRVRRCERLEEVPQFLDYLFELHQKRWELRGKEGSFVLEQKRSFYAEMAMRFLLAGWLDFWLLEVDGRTAAVEFGFHYNGVYSFLQAGFDPQFAEYSAGVVLRAQIMKELIQRGLREYDFLGGDDEYKQHWAPATRSYVSLSIARPYTLAAAGLALEITQEKAKEWLRTHTPKPLWSAAKVAYQRLNPSASPRLPEIQTAPFGQSIRESSVGEAQGTLPSSPQILEAPPSAVSVETGSVELLDHWSDEWRKLCTEDPEHQPFYRPEWIAAYLRAFEPEAKILLLTAQVGGQLSAILPLVEEHTHLYGLPVRRLRAPVNDHSGRFDIVRRRGQPGDAAVSGIWMALRDRCDWDLLEFKDAPAGGAVDFLASLAQADGFSAGSKSSLSAPYLRFDGTQSDADWRLQRVSPNLRQSLRRILRRTSEEGELRLRRIEIADSVELNRFYKLESAGWKGDRGSAIILRENTRRFYDEVARTAAQFGYLSLYYLELNGQLLAAQFGLAHGGRYYMPKCAIAETARRYAPGHLLIHAVLQDIAQRGFSEFDFMGSDDEYKMKWASGVRPHSDWNLFGESVVGRLLWLARFRVKALAKKLLVRKSKSRVAICEDRGELGGDKAG
jgi:CelD/BcsL family acetyltransferase involved in cellulose biosynthesis